jgi:hypothetical protein
MNRLIIIFAVGVVNKQRRKEKYCKTTPNFSKFTHDHFEAQETTSHDVQSIKGPDLGPPIPSSSLFFLGLSLSLSHIHPPQA